MALESLQQGMLASCIVFAVLSTFAFGLRIFARKSGSTRFGSDDIVIAVAQVLSLTDCIVFAWATIHAGYGKDFYTLDLPTMARFLKVTFVQEMISTPAIGLVKISVLLFYKRIFDTPRFILIANILIILSVIWAFSITLCLLLEYLPVYYNWTASPDREKHLALNFPALIMVMGISDIVLDILILSMPVPMIRRLNMPTRRKIAIGGVFATGAFCVIASVVRLIYIVEALYTFDMKTHFTSVETNMAIWTNIEPCASVIAACLPTLGPLSRIGRSPDSLFRKMRSYLSVSRSSKSSGKGADIDSSDASRSKGSESPEASLDMSEDKGGAFDRVVYVKREYGTEEEYGTAPDHRNEILHV